MKVKGRRREIDNCSNLVENEKHREDENEYKKAMRRKRSTEKGEQKGGGKGGGNGRREEAKGVGGRRE